MTGVICRNVTMEFKTAAGAHPVLKGVDFDAPAGEMTMLVGPSGCGKTTLISLVAGLLRGAGGSLKVFDREVNGLSEDQLVPYRLANIGFIFQQFNLIPTWNILENASIPLLLQGQSRRKAQDAAAKLLTEVGLGERLDAHPRQLSGGQQQRVAIARALVHEPRLLICDEPTASLDAATGHKVLELLQASACREDRCVIVVTHDSRIFSFADRIAEMEDGVVKGIHNSGEYKAQYV